MRHGTVWCLVASAFLFGCQPNAGATTASQLPSATHKNQANIAAESPRSGKSTLSSMLAIFVSDEGKRWSAYSSVPGVNWVDKSPREFADGKYDRSGRLLLTGFGMAKIPNGKTGPDYDVVDGNEGLAGVSLSGDASRVEMLSIKKFYFSEDYEGILKRQLVQESSIVRIAHDCADDEDAEVPGKRMFFTVTPPRGHVLYGEAFLDGGGKYGPGYTVFDFTMDKPMSRIRELGCKES